MNDSEEDLLKLINCNNLGIPFIFSNIIFSELVLLILKFILVILLIVLLLL